MSPMDKARRQGPCGFCGDPRASARHRLWDAVDVAFRIDRWSAKVIAEDRHLDVDEVRWVRMAFAAARDAHRPLPGRRVFA